MPTALRVRSDDRGSSYFDAATDALLGGSPFSIVTVARRSDAELRAVSDEHLAALVVTALPRRGSDDGALVQGLLRHGVAPVMLVPATMAGARLGPIVCGVRSPRDVITAVAASELARTLGRQLVLAGIRPRLDPRAGRRAHDMLDAIASVVDNDTAERTVAVGNATRRLLKLIAERDASALVIGSGHGGTRRADDSWRRIAAAHPRPTIVVPTVPTRRRHTTRAGSRPAVVGPR